MIKIHFGTTGFMYAAKIPQKRQRPRVCFPLLTQGNLRIFVSNIGRLENKDEQASKGRVIRASSAASRFNSRLRDDR